ncbi:g10458 [Coccomyxa elongata]
MSDISWSEHGDFMASGGEDCRVLVWSAERQHAVHTLDVGHVASINCVRFLPASNSEQIISCGSDRQVRLVSLRKNAVKPFCHHRGKVKTAVVLDPYIFMSGSDDGTVRQIDIREPVPGGSQQDHTGIGHENTNVIADQRQERTSCPKTKVGISSMAVMSLNPHMFITGGSDVLVRLYDRRMVSSSRSSAPSRVRWVSCFVPTHLKGALMNHRPFAASRSIAISGVAFTGDGQEILASYTSEQIYSFSTSNHARPPRVFGGVSVEPALHRASATQRTRARLAVHGRLRNAEPQRAGTNGAADANGMAASRTVPASRVAPMEPRPSTPHEGDAVAAAAAAPPEPTANGNAEGQGTIADALHRFLRPSAFHRPAAAAPAPPAQASHVPPLHNLPHLRPGPPRESSPAYTAPHEDDGVGSLPAGQDGSHVAGSPQQQQQAQQERADVPDQVMQREHHTTATAAVAREAAVASAHPEQPQARGSPQEAAREGHSPQEVQGTHRAAGVRAGSRPASFTGSALPPMAHSVGQLPHRAAAGGTPSTTAACAQARPSPDPQVATSPLTRSGLALRSQHGGLAHLGNVRNEIPGSNNEPSVPQDDNAFHPLRGSRRPKRRLAGGSAPDSDQPASKAHRAAGALLCSGGGSQIAAQNAAAPSGRPVGAPVDTTGSPDDRHLDAATAPSRQPAEAAAAHPSSPGAMCEHALRRTGSTMAAEGHVFAVAGSGAERPTASTGTSRPCRDDGRENELQSRLHSRRHATVAPVHHGQQPEPSRAPETSSPSPPLPQQVGDRRHLPFPMPLPRRVPSPAAAGVPSPTAAAATRSAAFGIPEWPQPRQPAARAAEVPHGEPALALSGSGPAEICAPAAPSREGSSQRAPGHAGASVDAGEQASGAAREHAVPTMPGRGPFLPVRHTRSGARAHQARSLPSSAAAITGTGPAEDGEPDVAGPPPQTRSSCRLMPSAEGRRRRRGPDSHVGAIVEAGDGDEGDGEEVEESGMFLTSFRGHCNRSGSREVALMGSGSQYVVSGSDDGHIFIWERATGALVNLLLSSDSGVSCVAPHPHLPMLASCGQDPVVRMWSPEAQEMAKLKNADAVMRRNAESLMDRAGAAAGPPPLWLNMIAPAGLAAAADHVEQRPRSPRGHNADRGDNPVRCSIM